MGEKVYVGKGKEIGQFGNIKLNICIKDFNGNDRLPINEKGWLKPLILTQMKQPDKHGNQYAIYIDDFVPDSNKKVLPAQEQAQIPAAPQEEDCPF